MSAMDLITLLAVEGVPKLVPSMAKGDMAPLIEHMQWVVDQVRGKPEE